MKEKITAIVLTFNEEKHIERCLLSIRNLATDILVVDSFSEDSTVAIAKKIGAEVIQNKWVNYAEQFNYALGYIKDKKGWVIRLDADEVFSDILIDNITEFVKSNQQIYAGLICIRRICFMGYKIKYGGAAKCKTLRIFKNGRGYCEPRWMDEHILLEGKAKFIEGEIIDNNLNSFTWWVNKHNHYASREAVDALDFKYKILSKDYLVDVKSNKNVEANIKRSIKNSIYQRLPTGIRALIYFVYRMIFRAGFLDGWRGWLFHFFQGFVYRMMVDVKIDEVEEFMKQNGATPSAAIKQILNIDVKF